MAKVYFKLDDLKNYVVAFFRHYNVSEEDARIVADVLTAADLRGVSSHGVIRLDTYYGSQLRRGMIDPASPMKVLSETAATLAIDAGKGMGQVVSYRTMQRCIEKAREAGACMATVRGSNHYGIAGYYAMMALPEDMIGISYTNAQPLVAPTYGSSAVLGTNPIAVAVPAGRNRPFVLDMATSIVPIGRITVYQKSGQEIPAGWGVDKDGLVTTDPQAVLAGGALMALGGTDVMRGYKGYGLGMMVEIFSGVLAGAAFASSVGGPQTERAANVGHYFAAIRVDAFRPVDEFKHDMDRLLDEVKNSPKAVGQERIYIAGEKEYEMEEACRKDGVVPLMSEVVDQMREMGAALGIPFELEAVRAE